MGTPSLAELWVDYAEGGMLLSEIARARRISYTTARKILSQHPQYCQLARERRAEGPLSVLEGLTKRIDVDRALARLEQGASTRAVAAEFGVCTRTLRKKLLPYPAYRRVMAARGVSRPGEARPH